MTTQACTQTNLEAQIDTLITKIWHENDTSARKTLIEILETIKKENPTHLEPEIVKRQLNTCDFLATSSDESIDKKTNKILHLILNSPTDDTFLVKLISTLHASISDEHIEQIWLHKSHHSDIIQKTLAAHCSSFLKRKVTHILSEVEQSGIESTKITTNYQNLMKIMQKGTASFGIVVELLLTHIKRKNQNEEQLKSIQVIISSLIEDIRHNTLSQYCALFPKQLRIYATILNDPSVRAIGSKMAHDLKNTKPNDFNFLSVTFPEILKK